MSNEVVLIQEAIYGRRKVGKCIQANEIIQAMSDDPLYIGCTADVLQYTQSLCAGRRECEIRVNDRNLEETKPCYSELKSYLEMAYICISGITLPLCHFHYYIRRWLLKIRMRKALNCYFIT